MENSSLNNLKESQAKEIDNYNISLLEEKLIVKRQNHKIGEVIVRKEVETRMVHLPIRREKLILEKVGVTTEHLAEVDLGEGQVNGVKFSELTDTNDIYLTQSNFVSLEAIKELFSKISKISGDRNIKLRLEIVTDNPQSQSAYQDICDKL